MLSVGNTLGSANTSLSLDARVAVGAGVFAVAPAETETAASSAPAVTDLKTPAYNAYEFTYRSDYGKVILLQQNVETGQEVTQIPTEYHLRQYAASQRAQRVQLQQQLYRGAATDPAPQVQAQKAQTGTPASGVAKTATVSSAPAVAPAAAQPAAPSVAPNAVAAAAVAHVDIKA